MIIIPQQFFGAGDAIFIQSLLRQLCEPGDKILYPIMPQFVDGFNRAYPNVTFIDYGLMKINYDNKTEVRTKDMRILPIRYADQLLKVPYHRCMAAKYELFGLDWNTWRDVKPKRGMEWHVGKELNLYWDLMRADSPMGGYNLISPYYGSNSQFKAPIEVSNGLPNVYMNSVEGYSLFDWSLLIENATTIHAVSSSIVYLLELLDLNATEVHLYGRHHEKETWLKNIEYLLTKNYITH